MAKQIFFPSVWFRLFIPLAGIACSIVSLQLIDQGVAELTPGLWSPHLTRHSPSYYHGIGWILLPCSIVSIAFGLVNLLPHACYLALDDDGLTAVIFFYRQRLKWKDIKEFRVFQFQPSASKRVAADLYDGSTAISQKARDYSQQKWGFDYLLPTNYGMSAQILADLLNMRRVRAQLAFPNLTDSEGRHF